MISRVISFFILISTAQPVFAAQGKPFDVGDCEKVVLGRSGEVARARIAKWLKPFDLTGLELLRLNINKDNLADDHIYGATDEEDQERTDFKPVHPSQDSPLSMLELSALGIPLNTDVPVKDIRLTLKSTPKGEMLLTSYHGEVRIGETRIAANRLRIGFQNSVQYYQSYWKAEGHETDLETFFGDQGFVLLPAGRFGFLFPLISTNRSLAESEYFEMLIYSMRECPNRDALLLKDILFPEKGKRSGAKNICLDNLGLKVIWPYKREE